MIDYAAILAELEDQEQQQLAELAKTHDAIVAIRPLSGGGGGGRGKPKSPPSNGRRPKATGGRPKKPAAEKAPAGDGRRSKVSDEQWTEARQAWDAGEKTEAIGKRLGISGAGVCYHAKVHGWPKRMGGRKKSAAPSGVQLAGRVSCPSCHLKTERDPCQFCGKPVRKSVAP